MQSAKEAREARRRRILERGSDRLAYITGELRSSPVSPNNSAPVEIDNHSPDKEAIPDRAARSDEATSTEAVERGASAVSPRLAENFADDAQATVATERPVDISSAFGSLSGNISSTRAHGMAGERYRRSFVREIGRTIDASEGVRAMLALSLAVIIACQILLSSCGHAWGNLLREWLPDWPVSLVICTDFSVIAGSFFLSSHKHLENDLSEDVGNFGSFTEALDVVGKFEDFLNIGLLCRKAANALSLDCCIYVVVLVCSLCLGQYGFSCSPLPGVECHI